METAACIVTLMREGEGYISMSDQSKISRRDLLKTAAIGAIGATTLGIDATPDVEAAEIHACSGAKKPNDDRRQV